MNLRASHRGQVSTEYAMLLSALLLVLVIVMVVMMGLFAQQSSVVEQKLADHAVVALAASAQEVWVGGPGTQAKVVVDLPPTFDSSRSAIYNRTIQLYLSGWGDVSRATPFNVSGYWPSKPGKFYAVLQNNNTTVVIRPSGGMFVNASGIYLSAPQGGLNSTSLLFINQASVAYTTSASYACPYNTSVGDTICTITSFPGTLAVGANQTVNVQIISSEVGLRSGYYRLLATPPVGSGLWAEEIIIPITLRVD